MKIHEHFNSMYDMLGTYYKFGVIHLLSMCKAISVNIANFIIFLYKVNGLQYMLHYTRIIHDVYNIHCRNHTCKNMLTF